MANRNCVLLVIVIAVCAAQSWGRFGLPTYAPVDRLIRNTTAYVAEHPDEAHGHYRLGRIHYLAFATRAAMVVSVDSPKTPEPAGEWLVRNYIHRMRSDRARKSALKELGYGSAAEVPSDKRDEFYELHAKKVGQLTDERWKPEELTAGQAADHAGKAADNFKKAISMDDENGLYHLGLASLYEQYVEFLKEKDIVLVPEVFRRLILDKAKEIYYTAFKLSIRKDLKHKYRPIAGLGSLVGYEAGRAYIRLAEVDESLSSDDKSKLAGVQKDIKKLKSLKMGAITPIIFSLEEHVSLRDLLADDLQVRFDLDGDGSVELWPWVKPTTGILVWDPQGEGRITSGRQLFGSVSWWLFFADGYRALDALDDNRDGTLTGAELIGIAVWNDRNSNGKSEPGEVTDITQTPITAVATRPSGKVGRVMFNRSGIKLNNGRALASYDWVVSPN